MKALSPADQIRAQILRAIALNRHPGYHFCGNFLDMLLTGVASGRAVVGVANQAGVRLADGSLSPFALTVAADFALANAIRSISSPSARFATVSMHLQLTGAPLLGDLTANSECEGFFNDSVGRLGLSRTRVHVGDELVAFGTGTFMVLPGPGGQALSPIPWINHPAPTVATPAESSLSDEERWIVARGEAALAEAATTGQSFYDCFLNLRVRSTETGAHATLQNGPHIGNRVAHVQGGISLGMALATANAALPPDWCAVGITASFVSPGEGDELKASANLVHRGRMTAVVQTRITGEGERIVLEVMSNHTKLRNQTAAD